MISDELKGIVELLNRQGKMSFNDPATEEQIKSFEKEKNVIFPAKYKEWLLFSDGGDYYLPAGVQVYGVAHKPLIDVDYDDRPDSNYIVIGALASGDPIIFKNNEEKIIVFDHENGEIEDDLIYENYFAFLNDLYELLGIGE